MVAVRDALVRSCLRLFWRRWWSSVAHGMGSGPGRGQGWRWWGAHPPRAEAAAAEAVAAEAARQARATFLFVGAPLRVKGGTGSPLNPLAVF